MSIEFRKSEVSDAEEIILVRANAFKEEVKIYGHGPNEMDSVEQEREFIKNTDGNNFSYILLDDGKIIGGMGGIDKGNGDFYLGCAYVALEYQSKGIGNMIMKFLYDKFPGAKKWTLETPYLSYRNHHFYERHGFVKVGETEPREDGFFLFLYENNRTNN
jgi:GNAT superfamily N-acetyltransferase